MSKRKRARSLRRMEREEAESLLMGGLVDDSIPESQVEQILREFEADIDVEAFKDYLRGRIGRYRAMRDSHEKEPTPADELRLLGEAVDVILEAQTRLDNLPPMASAYINNICWKRHGELYSSFQGRLDAVLSEAWSMLALTEREIHSVWDKKRRKSDPFRDGFLSDIADWLVKHSRNLDEPRALEITRQLCFPLKVRIPEYVDDDPAEFRRIINSYRKRGRGNR